MTTLSRTRPTSAEIAHALGGVWSTPSLLHIERIEAGDPLRLIPPDALYERLQLVRGVGPWHEAQLRAAGYVSLHDLRAHPHFGSEAARCLGALERREAHRLKELKGRGAPIGELLGLFAPHELVFLDIETMGLGFGQEVFLIGVLSWRDRAWKLVQLVLVDLEAQAELLTAALDGLTAFRACATYNGASFDLPFLRTALEFANLATDTLDGLFHADLLYPTRQRYRDVVDDCRLTTIAGHVLGMTRDDDIDGAFIPFVFVEFLRTRRISILQRILEHNRQDLLALRDLTAREALTG